jgi:hypothetical protein
MQRKYTPPNDRPSGAPGLIYTVRTATKMHVNRVIFEISFLLEGPLGRELQLLPRSRDGD